MRNYPSAMQGSVNYVISLIPSWRDFVLGSDRSIRMPPYDPTKQSIDESGTADCVRDGWAVQLLDDGVQSEGADVRQLTLDIHQCQTWELLAQICVRGIRHLLGAVDVQWLELTSSGQRILWNETANTSHQEFMGSNLEVMIGRSSDLRGFHERVQLIAEAETEECLRLSDHFTLEDLKTNPYYQDFLKPMGVVEILSFQAFHSGAGVVIISIGLKQLDLSGYLMEALKFLRSHIRIACAKLTRMTSNSNLTAALSKIRQQRQLVGISVVSNDGVNLWDVDEASQMILSELGIESESDGAMMLPLVLSEWVLSHVNKRRRLCAVSDEYNKTIRVEGSKVINACLYIEQVGKGAVLVLKKSKGDVDYGGVFTRRELDVVRCLELGMPSQETSEELSISKRTVDKHLENIYQKLGVCNRLAAVRRIQELRGEA